MLCTGYSGFSMIDRSLLSAHRFAKNVRSNSMPTTEPGFLTSLSRCEATLKEPPYWKAMLCAQVIQPLCIPITTFVPNDIHYLPLWMKPSCLSGQSASHVPRIWSCTWISQHGCLSEGLVSSDFTLGANMIERSIGQLVLINAKCHSPMSKPIRDGHGQSSG